MANQGRSAWRQVLNGDPLDWLLEEDNPPVRYLTLTQLLGRPPDDAEVVRAGRAVFDYPPAQRLLELLDDAPRDLDSLYRFGEGPPGPWRIRFWLRLHFAISGDDYSTGGHGPDHNPPCRKRLSWTRSIGRS